MPAVLLRSHKCRIEHLRFNYFHFVNFLFLAHERFDFYKLSKLVQFYRMEGVICLYRSIHSDVTVSGSSLRTLWPSK